MLTSFLEWLQEMSFASRFGVKNQWVQISARDVEEDHELAAQIFNLIDDSYRNIGGHVKIRSPGDVIRLFKSGDMAYFKAIDVGSGGIDALVGYKNQYGNKAVVAAANKNNPAARDSFLSYSSDAYKTKGNYAEVSDAAAGILLKSDVPVVQDEKLVRTVLGGKGIRWYGNFPPFEVDRLKQSGIKDSVIQRFTKYKGWYGRVLADGKEHVKIMVGMPAI